MKITDRIDRANARSRRVPSLVFRVFLAWFASAILLAVLVTTLSARGIALQGWMPWAVILGFMALAVGPELARRIRRRE